LHIFIAHALRGHISTSDLKSDITIVFLDLKSDVTIGFLDLDFLKDAKISAIRVLLKQI